VKYNSVLLAALHDVRFHAASPMFSADRSSEGGSGSDVKAAMQVHGPVATFVGDECLGCTRGWSHHCPVLQRRIPAVKRRAKIQPGLSSLVATRIGLGLRPQWPRIESQEESPVTHDDDAMEWRNSNQQRDLDIIEPIASYALTEPSTRVDDIALFIEEALALATLPPSEMVESEDELRSNQRWYRCGRCRQITDRENGCIQCQRAQLVMHSTKQRQLEKNGNLFVKTIILGRAHSKEKTVELPEGDRAVAKKLLKSNWLPVAILPRQSVPVPRPSTDSYLVYRTMGAPRMLMLK
jgi:hypothetical protein